MEANDYILNQDDDKKDPPSRASSEKRDCEKGREDAGNQGTLIIDAACAPANIRYPQDISLLNEAREKLETIIYRFCKSYGLPLPRRYRRKARKEYLSFAKGKKHSKKQVRKAVKKQLSYVRRDLGVSGEIYGRGLCASKKEILLLLTIMKLYEQQLYIYENKTHTAEHRIVSISQPWLRPIVRGKAKAPVEFGVNLDLSIDEKGYSRIEQISFEAYNESIYSEPLQNAEEDSLRLVEPLKRVPRRDFGEAGNSGLISRH